MSSLKDRFNQNYPTLWDWIDGLDKLEKLLYSHNQIAWEPYRKSFENIKNNCDHLNYEKAFPIDYELNNCLKILCDHFPDIEKQFIDMLDTIDQTFEKNVWL